MGPGQPSWGSRRGRRRRVNSSIGVVVAATKLKRVRLTRRPAGARTTHGQSEVPAEHIQETAKLVSGRLEYLLEVICVGEGELYLPDSFLQLAEINEMISELCTVAL